MRGQRMSNQNTPNSTCDDSGRTQDDLDIVLGGLSMAQVRFVIARGETLTDKAAALSLGMKPDTVKHWPLNRRR